MIDAGAEIASNQIQYSLLDRRPELQMVDYCRANGVALLPYGVVAGGLLSDKYLGVKGEDVDVDTSSKRKYASVLGYAAGTPGSRPSSRSFARWVINTRRVRRERRREMGIGLGGCAG